MNSAQPDVTLHLDNRGVIRDVDLSGALLEEGAEELVGRRWEQTVGEFAVDSVKRMIENARLAGVSGFSRIAQRFPSGRELQIEYTTIRLGSQGLIAVGKSLTAVAELESRLVAAQQAMERDYWKLREIETRYRLLFDASNEPVVLIDVDDLRIVEANPAAIRALGVAPAGWDFVPELSPDDRQPFLRMLDQVRERGRAPALSIRLGREQRPWLVRATVIAAEPAPVFLVQLAPVQASFVHGAPLSVERLIERLPDGFIVIDRDGNLVRANPAFLDLVQVGAEASLAGRRLHRWLGQPGADAQVLLAQLRKHGQVRLFATVIQGELDSEVEVEISAAADRPHTAEHFCVLLRSVGQRVGGRNGRSGWQALVRSFSEQVGEQPLRHLVRDSVAAVEQHYIEAALLRTEGNRTAAAELLGLSRQSLYVKLKRYDLEKYDEPAEFA